MREQQKKSSRMKEGTSFVAKIFQTSFHRLLFYLAQTDSSRDCETIKEGRSIDQQILQLREKIFKLFFFLLFCSHIRRS